MISAIEYNRLLPSFPRLNVEMTRLVTPVPFPETSSKRPKRLTLDDSALYGEYVPGYAVAFAQRNKPPPTEEELEERERLFQESREVEYAAIREQNAKNRERDIELRAEVSISAPEKL